MSPNYALSVTKPILCVGCLTIDLITLCADEPQVGVEHECLEAKWQRGGHSSNVSCLLRMLGAQVEFFGMLSRSSLAYDMWQQMQRCNIDLSHCPRTDEEPNIATIWIAKKTKARTIINSENRNFPYVSIKDFKQLDLSLYGWVHFEARNVFETILMMRSVLDYNNGRPAKERIRISLKVKDGICYRKSIDLFDMCDYVLCSRQMAQQQGWQTMKEACLELDKNLPLPRTYHVRRPCVICSWGHNGAGCVDTQGKYYELPAQKCLRPVDTYGAGDCFTAAVIYALYVRDMNLADAVGFGNLIAGQKLTAMGSDHIAKLNTFRANPEHDDTHRPKDLPKAEEVKKRICQKYFDRPLEHSNGELATKLLQVFNPNDYKFKEEPIVNIIAKPEPDPILESFTSAEAEPKLIPSATLKSVHLQTTRQVKMI